MKMMPRRSLLAAALAAPLPALAEFRVEITGIGATQLPIAIPAFRDEAGAPQPVSRIIRDNLARSGRFSLADAGAVVLNELSSPVWPDWRAKAADALVGGSLTRLADGRWDLRFRLWDVVAGKKLWSAPNPGFWNGGTMATAGNLVFQGHADGSFNAYASGSGKKVWSFQAQTGVLQALGRHGLLDIYQDRWLQELLQTLKQGAGRLIRSETDRGLLVVCDPRMAGMNYGRRLREALPPMTRVANEAEATAWLETLAGERAPA